MAASEQQVVHMPETAGQSGTGLFPCRIDDADAPEVMICALGEVESPLAQGVFDPAHDQVIRPDGTVIEDYYADHLGVQYYTPLDMATFPPIPMGWCSWSYYGRDVTPEEVLVNARWLAEHFRDYGVRLILLDDGWQADGRNWEGLRETFPQGMKWLASEISALGMTPGLWICPHGQDNRAFVEATGGFIPCDTFGGPYSVDPTHPAGKAYLGRLMRRLIKEWGYEYLKFDGIYNRRPTGYGVHEGYARHQHLLADSAVSGEDAFRRLLRTCLDNMDGAVLGGCGTLCYSAVGLCHSERTGADVDPEWEKGFMNAVEATMNGYFLHHFCVYTDPDYCLLRLPLTRAMAEAWATLLGLTGQMLLFADRMPDLGPDRIALMKKILPVAGIRPFDLFPAAAHKPVIDLKIDRLGRAYDVVGIFNYDVDRAQARRLDFKELGLRDDCRYHAYDFWNSDYLGVYEHGLFLDIAPASCRVITLMQEGDFPVLLSTNRHLTQGWPDLETLTIDPDAMTISGTSQVMAGEPYMLVFGLPNDGTATWQVERVQMGEPHTLMQGRGDARVSWTPQETGAVQWEVKFARVPLELPFNDGSFPFMLGARDIDPWTVELFWVSFGSSASFYVEQDGELLGYVFGNRCRVGKLISGREYRFTVGVADLTGYRCSRTNAVTCTVGETLPAALYLSDLPWEIATTEYMMVRADKSVGGTGLSAAGKRYAKGIGTHPESRISYSLRGVFTRLTGKCAIEDQNGAPEQVPLHERGYAMFSIIADGKVLLPPTRKSYGEEPTAFDLDLTGVQVLELLVTAPTDGPRNVAPHADWLEMVVIQ